MASYKCPCCGQPYNGKRCKSCYYENFTEEITHGNHTHAGEPLVIRQTTAKTRPQPTIRRESDCKPYVGKKKKKSSPLKWVVLVIALLSLVSEIRETVEVERIPETRPVPDASMPVASSEPDDLEMPEAGLVLYDDGEVLVMAEWNQGRAFENPVTIWIQNHTDMKLTLTTREMYVNGSQMESATLRCQAEPGRVARGELMLDEAELKRCGITDVQQIRLDLWLIDMDNAYYYARTDLKSIDYAVPTGES